MNEIHVTKRSPNLGKLFFGLTLLALGILFTLDNLDVIDSGSYFRWWPVLLIAFGLSKVLQPRESGGRMFGLIAGLIGLLFLLKNLDKIRWDVWDLWPLLLVLLGLSIVWEVLVRGPDGSGRRGRRHGPFVNVTVGRDERDGSSSKTWSGSSSSSDSSSSSGSPPASETSTSSGERAGGSGFDLGSTVDSFTFFGGNERYSTSRDFRGGKITAIMGGCDVDLRQASIASGEAVLDLTAVFGGIEIRVPVGWRIVNRVSAFLGGVEDSSAKPGDPAKTLVVRGNVLFGGVEIKN